MPGKKKKKVKYKMLDWILIIKIAAGFFLMFGIVPSLAIMAFEWDLLLAFLLILGFFGVISIIMIYDINVWKDVEIEEKV